MNESVPDGAAVVEQRIAILKSIAAALLDLAGRDHSHIAAAWDAYVAAMTADGFELANVEVVDSHKVQVDYDRRGDFERMMVPIHHQVAFERAVLADDHIALVPSYWHGD